MESDTSLPDSGDPATPHDLDDAAPPPPSPPQPTATDTSEGDANRRGWAIPTMVAAGLVVALALVASQAYIIATLRGANDDVDALEAQVGRVEENVAALAGSVDSISDSVADIAVEQAAGRASAAPAHPDGHLPRFVQGAADSALGLTLPTVTGVDGYADGDITIDPSDGTNRVWLIWAHWCPYCQQELPVMADWWPSNAGEYSAELVSITTSIDPTRGNPLDAYLEAEEFPFPVLVDETDVIASQFGVSAFPFWVVTAGDGTVLFRTAGLLPTEQVDQIFTQLEDVGA